MDFLGPLIEGILHWLASDRARWLWIVIGLIIVALAWVVADGSLAAGIAICLVGALAILYGVLGTILNRRRPRT